VTSDQKQFNWFTIGKKLKRDKQNWMEQQCTEVEEALKRNRIQELNNKVKLVSGTL